MSKMKQILLSKQAPLIGYLPAYANTLTALIPDIYTAMDIVSRELVGVIPSAMRAPGVERAAVGQQVNYPIAPEQSSYDIVPAMTVPEPPDNTFTTGTMAITKSKGVPFGITGEEQRALGTGGPGNASVQAMWIAQAMRTLTNEIEDDAYAAAVAGASRAYGTAGTTPFASDDISALAQVRKILNDNGAPTTGRSVILDSTAAANLITVKNLTRVNEAGDSMTLRDGEITRLYGLSVKETGATVEHTKGTAAGATTNATGYAVGSTVITLASAGTGTIVAGDVVTFAGDANKYVVEVGDASVANGGTITLASPGLREAIPASATAITVGNNYSAAGVAFSMDALHIAMRPPAMPEGGDSADDSMMFTDPRSGIPFELLVYRGYKKVRWEIGMAWGVKLNKSAHAALLLG